MLNNTVRFALGLAGAALLAGCQQSEPYMKTARPHVKPGLILIPADQVRLYRSDRPADAGRPPPGWDSTDVRSVQTDPVVSALQFNRYPDPARPRELMHEAHIVYRRETSPRWRLRPVAGEQQILIGPSLTDGRGEIQPLQSAELDAYMREQRANAQRQEELVLSFAQSMQRLAAQQEQLAREMAVLKAGGIAPTSGGEERDADETEEIPSLPE